MGSFSYWSVFAVTGFAAWHQGTQHICGEGAHVKTDLQLPTRKHVVSLLR